MLLRLKCCPRFNPPFAKIRRKLRSFFRMGMWWSVAVFTEKHFNMQKLSGWLLEMTCREELLPSPVPMDEHGISKGLMFL